MPNGNDEMERLRTVFEMKPQESGEGTLIRQNLRDGFGTAIVALIGGDHYSALHRLDSTEVYHFYAGAPRRLLLLFPDGRIEEPVLGRDYEAGHRPQVVVPKGVWQGSRSDGPWSLTGATMAPGFRHEGFEFPDVEELVRQYPSAELRIRDLAPRPEALQHAKQGAKAADAGERRGSAGDFDLHARVAIVTGSTRGIGLGIACRLREAGASVMCNARASSTTELEGYRTRVRCMGFHAADVSTHEGAAALVSATLAEFGRLDIVVNNAGTQPSGKWSDTSLESFDAVMDANARSVECMIRAALPALGQASDGAAIVNVASVRAERPGSGMAHYSASKAAIVALTRGLAAELGPRHIRVNAISPGLVERPGLAESWPEGVARFTSEAPLRRLGRPADVAGACLFLVSPAAAWITGVNLVVDGGISLVR